MTGHEVETASLSRASSELATTADAIGSALGQSRAALSGSSGAFGQDEINAPFTREYLPLVDRAMTAITSYAEQVRYASGGLAQTAELLRTVEDLNVEAMARLRQPWTP